MRTTGMLFSRRLSDTTRIWTALEVAAAQHAQQAPPHVVVAVSAFEGPREMRPDAARIAARQDVLSANEVRIRDAEAVTGVTVVVDVVHVVAVVVVVVVAAGGRQARERGGRRPEPLERDLEALQILTHLGSRACTVRSRDRWLGRGRERGMCVVR